MRFLRGPMVSLLVFIIGVAISPIRFYAEGTGVGRVIDGGGGFSITSYRSTYFVRLSFVHSGYLSTEKANQVFAELLGEAFRVVEHMPKFNKNGALVGQRAVAVFFDTETNQYIAVVFWTDGRFLHSIHSSSYLHVIEFEKRNVD
jgi:hypothetical protein